MNESHVDENTPYLPAAMKRWIIFWLFLGFSLMLTAGEIPSWLAEQVAIRFLRMELGKYPGSLEQVIALSRDGSPLGYFFNFPDNNGYILVAADDRVHPILAFSFRQGYREADSFPPQYLDWITSYADQIEDAIQRNLPADSAIRANWEKYGGSGLILSKAQKRAGNPEGTTSVAPLLTTTWNQGCYYNELCPADDDGPCDHVWTGCVATAMAQIMKYHNQPVAGTGSHSYNAGIYGTLSANFGNALYNWTGMQASLSGSDMDVATLMFHCGVAVDMSYSTSGSGAYPSASVYAYKTYFGYDPACAVHYKSSYSAEAWVNLLKNDLDNGRPIQYAGYGTGGHAFVCDGYEGANYFHFNWGWGGAYDGYFYLDALNPGGANFTYIQNAILNIHPLPGGDPVIANGESRCFNAPEHMVVAGSGHTFSVQTGGSATLIAGAVINYLPGTTVQSGGYMHGYIAPGGPWCNSGSTLPLAEGNREDSVVSSAKAGSPLRFDWQWAVSSGEELLFRIYPNPTSESFTLELRGIVSGQQVEVEINSLHGEKILKDSFAGESRHEFSLSGHPAGIYVVRIVTEGMAETTKVVKI